MVSVTVPVALLVVVVVVEPSGLRSVEVVVLLELLELELLLKLVVRPQ